MQAFFLSLLFGLSWVVYFARKDRKPEPAAQLLLTFAAGALLVAPVSQIEVALRHWMGGNGEGLILTAFLVVAPLEEVAKALAGYGVALRTRETDEPADYYIYLVVAALGFATLENMFYTRVWGLGALPVRAGVTSLAHASFSAWLAHGWVRGNAAVGMVLATLAHGVYDSLLFAGGLATVAALLVVAAGLAVLTTGVRSVQKAG